MNLHTSAQFDESDQYPEILPVPQSFQQRAQALQDAATSLLFSSKKNMIEARPVPDQAAKIEKWVPTAFCCLVDFGLEHFSLSVHYQNIYIYNHIGGYDFSNQLIRCSTLQGIIFFGSYACFCVVGRGWFAIR
jgi:hypothetical protein